MMRNHIPSFEYTKNPTTIFGLKWVPTIDHGGKRDNHDYILDFVPGDYEVNPGATPRHWSERSNQELLEIMNETRDSVNVIMEIGVHSIPQYDVKESSTLTFLREKKDDCVYVGVDKADKSFVSSIAPNVKTLRCDSGDHGAVRGFLRQNNIDKIDILMIDGWHSIVMAFSDWRYADLLSDNGVVLIHDVNHHPGPYLLLEAIDEAIFDVRSLVPEADHWEWGLGYARRK